MAFNTSTVIITARICSRYNSDGKLVFDKSVTKGAHRTSGTAKTGNKYSKVQFGCATNLSSDSSTFIDVIAWNDVVSEKMLQHLTTGTEVQIVGELQDCVSFMKRDNTPSCKLSVKAMKVMLVGGNSAEKTENAKTTVRTNDVVEGVVAESEVTESEIPAEILADDDCLPF